MHRRRGVCGVVSRSQNGDSTPIYQLKIFGHVGQSQSIRCTARLPLRDMCPAPCACDGAGPTVRRHGVRARGYAAVRGEGRSGQGGTAEVGEARVQGSGHRRTRVLSGRPADRAPSATCTETTCNHASAPEHSLDQTRDMHAKPSQPSACPRYDVYGSRLNRLYTSEGFSNGTTTVVR